MSEWELRTAVVVAARNLVSCPPHRKQMFLRRHRACAAAKWNLALFLAENDYARVGEFTPVSQAIHNLIQAEWDTLVQKEKENG